MKGRRITHGMSKTREYHIWFNMMDRCYNPANAAYANYGGRGITVCERWHMFENFYADICPRPVGRLTLDRKDNSLGYSKENCRWTTYKIQQRNRRDNRLYTINGETCSVSEWSERFGLRVNTVLMRLNSGWPIEKALHDSRKYRMLTFNGATLSVAQWSKTTGIEIDTILKRLDKYRWTIERTLMEPVNNVGIGHDKFLIHNGRSMTISEWARVTGLAKTTISSRIHKLHWSIDRALSHQNPL